MINIIFSDFFCPATDLSNSSLYVHEGSNVENFIKASYNTVMKTVNDTLYVSLNIDIQAHDGIFFSLEK